MSNLLKKFSTYSRLATFFIPSSIVAGFVGMAVFNSFNETSIDQPSSIERNTASAVQKKYPDHFNRVEMSINTLGKMRAFVVASLESPSSIPETADTELILRGQVVLNQPNASAAMFKWILPEGVSAEGALEGVLDLKRANFNIPYEVQIVVKGFDQTERKIITLQANAIFGQEIFGSTALLSSRPQDSMEYLGTMKQKAVEDLLNETRSQAQ